MVCAYWFYLCHLTFAYTCCRVSLSLLQFSRDANKELRESFAFLDTNKKGYLTINDLVAYSGRVADPISDQQARRMLEFWSTQDDNDEEVRVTFDDFCRWLEPVTR
jgi:Ca2+-binding EF-hand superfamily protein